MSIFYPDCIVHLDFFSEAVKSNFRLTVDFFALCYYFNEQQLLSQHVDLVRNLITDHFTVVDLVP